MSSSEGHPKEHLFDALLEACALASVGNLEARVPVPADASTDDPLVVLGLALNVLLSDLELRDRRLEEKRVQLARQESRFRSLVEATAEIVWVADENGDIHEDSPTWRAFTGQTREEFTSARWIEAVHPGDRARTLAAWRRATSTRSTYQVEYRLRRADGSYATTMARGVPVHAPDGSVREWVGMNVDVTAQREAEAALRERTALYEALVQSQSDLGDAVVLAEGARILWANDAYARLFGYRLDEVLDPSFDLRVLVPEEVREPFAERMRAIASGELKSERYETPIQRKDGTRGLAEVSVKAFGSPPVFRRFAILRDITQRRAAEEDTRRLAAIVRASRDAIVNVRSDGTIDTWSPGAERMFGYTAEEMIGSDATRIVPPERRNELSYAKRVLAGEHVPPFDTERVTKSGERIPVSVALSPLSAAPGSDPSVGSVVAIIRDARVKRELENALRRVEENERLSRLGALVLGVGHEIKTPLTYAGNHVHLLQRHIQNIMDTNQPLDAPRALALLEGAVEGLDRINQLVQELRRFVVVQPSRREESTLDEAVSSAVKIFRATHRGSHHVVEDLAPTCPLPLEVSQVQQVVLNLLQNSAEASPHGGTLTVSTRDLPDGAQLVVRDDGPGIPPETRARMFEAFFTTKASNTGLGLSIVRRIVEGHHGRVVCESEPGKGTTFVITFPRRPAAAAAPVAGDGAAAVPEEASR